MRGWGLKLCILKLEGSGKVKGLSLGGTVAPGAVLYCLPAQITIWILTNTSQPAKVANGGGPLIQVV